MSYLLVFALGGATGVFAFAVVVHEPYRRWAKASLDEMWKERWSR